MVLSYHKMVKEQVHFYYIQNILDYDYNNTINIQELTKFNWPNVEWLGLYGCGIDDNGWRMLVDRACVFAQLKVLGLSKFLFYITRG